MCACCSIDLKDASPVWYTAWKTILEVLCVEEESEVSDGRRCGHAKTTAYETIHHKASLHCWSKLQLVNNVTMAMHSSLNCALDQAMKFLS